MKILDEFVEILINNDIIDNEEKCIYEYGLKQGVLMLINLVTIIIVGIFFSMIIESVVFTFAYIPLRTYAGGYHAKNQLLCYFFSIGMIIVALLGIKIINLFSIVSGVIIMISFISIYIFSPVEDHNKLLSEKEKVIYRKKSIRIFIIEFAILLMLMTFRQYKIVNSIVMAQVFVAVMVVIGKIKQMVI
jgi:accessory gene regulator B